VADSRRVLVVEDERGIREALEAALLDEGYEVRTATHGREALDTLAAWPADLILLDLMLPIMDGWVFLRERRRLGAAPDARVIVVSATRESRDGTAADLGVDAVVPKPFDLGRLLDTTARLLAG
jgi:two-component system chemotaxis response regulator CheY